MTGQMTGHCNQPVSWPVDRGMGKKQECRSVGSGCVNV